MRTATKKKKKTNDLKIAGSFDLTSDFESPDVDRIVDEERRLYGGSAGLSRKVQKNLPREKAKYRHLKGV